MPSVTLNVPFSQINIKRSIKKEILKSLWRMSCPHRSWRLGSLPYLLSLGSIPGSVSPSSFRNIDFSLPPISFTIQIKVYCIPKLPRPRNSTTTLLLHLSISAYCWVPNWTVYLFARGCNCFRRTLSPAIKLLSSALRILSVHFFIWTFYVLVSVPSFLIYFGNLSETGKFCVQLPFKQQLW